MSHPPVTVIINTWNHQGFIADAFLSAVNQADELIVVDDGSTDGTWNVLEGLRSVHSNVLTIRKKNGGQASACQVGMEHAQGDVVIFLDGDDMLAPNAVQRVKETWTPGVSKIQWQMQVVNERGRETGQVFPKFPKNDFDARQLLIDTGAYPDTPTSGNAYCAAILPICQLVQDGLGEPMSFETEIGDLGVGVFAARMDDQRAVL